MPGSSPSARGGDTDNRVRYQSDRERLRGCILMEK
jgi:hypothetical protein